MDKRGQSEAAAKFISALIKSMQTLCHGYLEFQSGIEIIGHINVSVDKASSLDYVLKEKVCRNHENSTMFVSDTFRAEAKAEELALRKLQCAEQTAMIQQTEGRLSSALSSITSSLAGPRSRNARKGPNKRRSSQDHSSNAQPTKMSHMESSPRGSGGGGGSSPGRSRTSLQTVTVTDGGTTTETLLPQTAGLGEGGGGLGVNLAASVLESVANQNDSDLHRDDDSDNDLEVTFIKEEYGSHGDGSTPDFDPASDNQFVHRGFMPGAFDPGQFPGGEGGPQPGPSGMRGSRRRRGEVEVQVDWSTAPLDPEKNLPFSQTEENLIPFSEAFTQMPHPPPSSSPPTSNNNTDFPFSSSSAPLLSHAGEEAEAAVGVVGGQRSEVAGSGAGSKAFRCQVCNYSVDRSDSLRRHMRLHTGNMFRCELCGLQYNSKHNLTTHHKKKHPDMPLPTQGQSQGHHDLGQGQGHGDLGQGHSQGQGHDDWGHQGHHHDLGLQDNDDVILCDD